MLRFNYVFVVLVSLAGISSSQAQPIQSGSYYCVSKAAGGLYYNEKSREWEGAKFNPRARFVWRIVYERSRTADNQLDPNKKDRLDDYRVTVTEEGSSNSWPCTEPASSSPTVTTYTEAQIFSCTTIFKEYRFNGRNNRFLVTYPIGYIDGKDKEAGDTPMVYGGTCTKID